MPLDHSELSSMTTLLGQLTERVGQMGDHARDERADDVAKELYGAERALTGVRRRLERLNAKAR